MSHIETASILIKDLDVLEKILREQFKGAALVRGATTHNWFGISIGDYPLPEGVTKDELGKCDHKITLSGCGYEIGLKAQKDGSFKLLYDFWGEGQRLKETFGDKLKKLCQAYSVEALKTQARKIGVLGKTWVLPSGSVQVQIGIL